MLQVVPAPPDPDGFQPSGLARLVLWLILVVISVFQFILTLAATMEQSSLESRLSVLARETELRGEL